MSCINPIPALLRPFLSVALILLPLLATPAQAQTESDWTATLTRAEQLQDTGDDASAVPLLQKVITDGTTLFGPDSPRLIWPLELLSYSLTNLDRAPDSTLAILRAIRLARTTGSQDDLLSTLSNLARDRLNAGDTATAALAAADLVWHDTADNGTLGPHAIEGTALWAIALLRAGHPDDALARLLPILSLPPGAVDDDTSTLIDTFYAEAGETDEASVNAWYDRAIALQATQMQNDDTLLQALIPLDAAIGAADALQADRAGRLALAQVTVDNPLVALSYAVLLDLTQSTGHDDLAATWALRLAAMPPPYLASLAGDPMAALSHSATWAIDQGRLTEAITLGEAIAALAPLRDPSAIPMALHRLGLAYRDAGRAPDALRTLHQALATLGPDDAPLAIQTQTDLALLALDQNDPKAAEAAYHAARTLLTTTDATHDPKAWAYVLSEERLFLTQQNRLPEALATAQQAVTEITARTTDPALLNPALRDLADSQLANGDAHAAQSTLANLPQTPRVAALQAAIAAALGQTPSLTLPEATDTPGIIALIEAATTAAQTNPATARTLITAALNALPPDHPMRPYILAGRATITPDPTTALKDLRAATTILSQPDRRAEPQARDPLALHVTTARRLHLLPEAFEVAQRVGELSAAAALTRATARLQGDGPQAANLARRLQKADTALDLARQAHLANLSSDPATKALQSARDTRTALLTQLAKDFPNYAGLADPGPTSLSDLAALLGPDEALLLYETAKPPAIGTVFAVTRDGVLSADLPPRDELATMTRDLRCAAALTDPSCGNGAMGTRGAFSLDAAPDDHGFDLSLARRLGQALIDPVAPLLNGKTSLLIVPDRTMSALPFALLLTADTPPDTPLNAAPWLIRQTAITILPSVASLSALRRQSQHPSTANLPFLGIGDPLIGAQAKGPTPYNCNQTQTLLAMTLSRGSADTLPALPDTRCELARAAALFGTPDAVLLHNKASETNLKSLSQQGHLARYRVLSFATHGLIAGELGASNAALVLTPTPQDDGLLTSDEVAALRLDADFVILSACNTGAGNADTPEGLSGLASAFFLAGARSVLVSQWPVYSDAATELTSGMVQALADTPGLPKAQALRRSMLAILDDPGATARSQHPAYWAPFLITGNGD